MDTYTCAACKFVRHVSVRKRKRRIKIQCARCGKKRRFELTNDSPKITGIEDGFVSSYTLAADLTVKTNNVRIEGINVRGNVNILAASGSSLKGIHVMTGRDKQKSGSINIEASTVGLITSNVVAGDVNLHSSHVGSLDRNLIGFSFDHDAAVLQAINALIEGKNLSQDLERELALVQQVLTQSTQVADKFGGKLRELDRAQNGAIGSRILGSLKKMGIDTLEKAKTKGLDKFLGWLFTSLGL